MQKYDTINALWWAQGGKPITREEAERAVRKIHAHFGRRELGSPNMIYDTRPGRVRRCWMRRPGVRYRTMVGWPRLAHDVSHDIFAARHPSFKPHAAGHDTLELEISQYIVDKGWLSGSLRSPVKAKPAGDALRALKLKRAEEAVTRWTAKARRAERALRKARRTVARLRRCQGQAQVEIAAPGAS